MMKNGDTQYFCFMSQEEREIPIVLVQLDDDSKYKLSKNNVVPIMAVECLQKVILGDDKYTRWQLPLLPAHARTTHSCQGITAWTDIIVDVRNQFYGGLYVAISRAKELSRIFLTEAMKPKHFQIDEKFRQIVHTFYELLRTKFPQTPSPPPPPLP